MGFCTVKGEGKAKELSDGYHFTEDNCNGIGCGEGMYLDGSSTTPGVRPYPLTDDAFGHGLGSGFGLVDKPGIPTNVDTTYNDLNIRG